MRTHVYSRTWNSNCGIVLVDCSKACQKSHWTDGGHKKRCSSLAGQVQAAKARAAASQSKGPKNTATATACLGTSTGAAGGAASGSEDSDNTCPICLDNPDDYERYQGPKYLSKGLCYNCGQVRIRAEQALAPCTGTGTRSSML